MVKLTNKKIKWIINQVVKHNKSTKSVDIFLKIDYFYQFCSLCTNYIIEQKLLSVFLDHAFSAGGFISPEFFLQLKNNLQMLNATHPSIPLYPKIYIFKPYISKRRVGEYL